MAGALVDTVHTALGSGHPPLEDGAAGCESLADEELLRIHFKIVLGVGHGALEHLDHQLAAGLGRVLHKSQGHVCLLAADHIADDFNLAGRNTGVFVLRTGNFLLVHFLSSLLTSLAAGVAAEGAGGGELAQLVAHHVLSHVDGHVLHVVCDLSIASENAIFGQTGPRVGSFDAGFGASYLARVVGQKKAREIWFLCRKYNAQEALDMGLVNKVVPLEQLEDEYVQWAEEMMLLSPLALRMIKAGLNAELDGQAGIQELAGDATLLYYLTDEAQEGKNAFLEKRKPNFKQYPKFP